MILLPFCTSVKTGNLKFSSLTWSSAVMAHAHHTLIFKLLYLVQFLVPQVCICQIYLFWVSHSQLSWGITPRYKWFFLLGSHWYRLEGTLENRAIILFWLFNCADGETGLSVCNIPPNGMIEILADRYLCMQQNTLVGFLLSGLVC